MARRKNPVIEADKELQKEGERQAMLIHGAAALAMYRHWGWRKNRILDMLDKVEEVWNECASDIDHSMIEMCDTETGIEIQCGDGKTWKDLHYLNHKVDPGRMTPAKWIYMRRQQKKVDGAADRRRNPAGTAQKMRLWPRTLRPRLCADLRDTAGI